MQTACERTREWKSYSRFSQFFKQPEIFLKPSAPVWEEHLDAVDLDLNHSDCFPYSNKKRFYTLQAIAEASYKVNLSHFEQQHGVFHGFYQAEKISALIPCYRFLEQKKSEFLRINPWFHASFEQLQAQFLLTHFYPQIIQGLEHINAEEATPYAVFFAVKKIDELIEIKPSGLTVKKNAQGTIKKISGRDPMRLVNYALAVIPENKRLRVHLTAKGFDKQMQVAESLRSEGRLVSLVWDTPRPKPTTRFFKDMQHHRYQNFLKIHHLIKSANQALQPGIPKALAVYFYNTTSSDKAMHFRTLSDRQKINTYLKLANYEKTMGFKCAWMLLQGLSEAEIVWLQQSLQGMGLSDPLEACHLAKQALGV